MNNKQLIEVCRSFGQNLFLEAFKPINFFASAKAEVPFEEIEEISKELYHLCKRTVEKDIEDYKKEKESENTIQLDEKPPKKNDVDYEKGFSAGYREAKNPNAHRLEPKVFTSDSDKIMEKLKTHVRYPITEKMKQENTLTPK